MFKVLACMLVQMYLVGSQEMLPSYSFFFIYGIKGLICRELNCCFFLLLLSLRAKCEDEKNLQIPFFITCRMERTNIFTAQPNEKNIFVSIKRCVFTQYIAEFIRKVCFYEFEIGRNFSVEIDN